MPGSAGSSWYFLRYTDPSNADSLAGYRKTKILDARSISMWAGLNIQWDIFSMLDFGKKCSMTMALASCPEPIQKLAHQGMILGLDGEKMSKSKGNL